MNTAFRVGMQRNKLAAVVVFEPADEVRSRFTVLLGSASDTGDAGAQVFDGWEGKYTFGVWAKMFDPQPPGWATDIGRDSIQVRIEPRVVYNRK